jgi:regulation of enolase protein 1 (concanavalin A-like superfamily)
MSSSRPLHAVILTTLALGLWPARMAAQVEWTRAEGGPVLTPQAAGEWEALGTPCVILEADGFVMYYVGDNVEEQLIDGIARAASADGLAWIPDTALILPRMPGSWENFTYSPRVLLEHTAEPSYRMWYAGNFQRRCGIGYATSEDGIAWQRHGGNPVLGPSQPWEETCTDWPSVLFDGTTYSMWYTAGNFDDLSRAAVGYATSHDGLTWTKHLGNPVLREGGEHLRHGAAVPCLIRDSKTASYEMWYTIFETPDGSVASVGYATSMDGIAWAKYSGNPVLAAGAWDQLVVEPWVLFGGREYAMWYGGGMFRRFSIGYATAPWSIPKASFTVDTAEPAAGELVVFDASRSAAPRGKIAAYRWDFGDGDPREEPEPEPIRTHRYRKPGHHVAVLTAIDEDGNEGSVARALDVRLECSDLELWTCTDIGEHTLPSGARFEGEGDERALQLFTRGGDIASRADTFHFVHREVEGDFTLTARIASLEASSLAAKVGLMVRESLEENARHAALVFLNQPGGLIRLLRRTEKDGTTRGTSDPTRQQPPELWLRLQRRDGEITAQASADGKTWRQVGEPVIFDPPLPGAVQLGVAASGGLPTLQGGYQDLLARLSRLELELPEPPEPEPTIGPFLRGDCNGDGQVSGQVTDAVFLLNFNFTGGAVPPCLAACDANGDGQVTGQVTDAVYLLQFNFLGGPPPPAPFPECGRSTREADLAIGCITPPERCR